MEEEIRKVEQLEKNKRLFEFGLWHWCLIVAEDTPDTHLTGGQDHTKQEATDDLEQAIEKAIEKAKN